MIVFHIMPVLDGGSTRFENAPHAAIRALDRAKWNWPDATPAECQPMNADIRIETSSPGSSTPSLAT
jgi:hypothetical protein